MIKNVVKSVSCLLFCFAGSLGGLQVNCEIAADELHDTQQIDVWPNYAPGESTRVLGNVQPPRDGEEPPVTRVVGITRPTFTVHLPKSPSGAAAVILPGGGFAKVVPDKEGTEAADWLAQHGVTSFVLSYRTSDRSREGWKPALQDAQRAIAKIRSQADEWDIDPDRLGMLAFSAGGQVAARLLCDHGKLAYEKIDAVDSVSHRPDFAILVYPWNLYDPNKHQLIDALEIPKSAPPTFIVHTDDDRSSSLGSVLFYSGLKRLGIPAELHVYGNGGHGYGLRRVTGSQISSWTDHASHWLGTIGVK